MLQSRHKSHLRAACVKTPLEKGSYNFTRAPSLKIKPLKMHGEATGSSLTTSFSDFSLISLLKGQYSKCHIQLGVYKGPSDVFWSAKRNATWVFLIIIFVTLKGTSA